eukprot:13295097-Alexandrium_andersonii.AAC.1
MSASLVGSEMCIRDRFQRAPFEALALPMDLLLKCSGTHDNYAHATLSPQAAKVVVSGESVMTCLIAVSD